MTVDDRKYYYFRDSVNLLDQMQYCYQNKISSVLTYMSHASYCNKNPVQYPTAVSGKNSIFNVFVQIDIWKLKQCMHQLSLHLTQHMTKNWSPNSCYYMIIL